ncbi:MAG: molybdenum cofactor biosynthesis protein MoaE [Firmicutes bacterium]|nr:molybdenum cofactor biosynthesis protein MoaE [Bacillota bacterium]
MSREVFLSIGGAKPSSEEWLKEAKASEDAAMIGMYLIHNGVVRETAKKEIYDPGSEERKVCGMHFSADTEKTAKAIEDALELKGVYYIRVWVADGELKTGDDIMQVLIGADCRPNCIDALTKLVGTIKNECVVEKEIL